MKNQNRQQRETLAKKTISGKDLLMSSLTHGIITTVFAAACLMMCSCASSQPSTQVEIEAQKEFQEKWNTAQKEAEQKWDSTLKATEQK